MSIIPLQSILTRAKAIVRSVAAVDTHIISTERLIDVIFFPAINLLVTILRCKMNVSDRPSAILRYLGVLIGWDLVTGIPLFLLLFGIAFIP